MIKKTPVLTSMMRHLADKDNLEPMHPMRVTASRLEEAYMQQRAKGEIDINALSSYFEEAHRIYREYTGHELGRGE